jgi:amino acid adenylation domain-containing protein
MGMEEIEGSMVDVIIGELEQSVPDCLEGFARKYPDRIAFKTKERALTWDALNRAANQVARAVLGIYENRARPVALLIDQESPMMAATLGVLKMGGFYVPLSPSHPHVRNSYILNETAATFIVTDGKNLAHAEELSRGNHDLLNIDDIDPNLPSDNLGLRVTSDSLAFITYTSGSTGEPKGVVNTHRKALYRITHDKHFGLGPNDRFTNAGSTERRTPFAPLLCGAASFPWYVKEEGLAHLADWLVEEEITVYRSSPRIFRHFVSTLTGKEEFPKLRAIVLAGEPIYKSDVALYKKFFSPDCLLVNSYGVHEVGPIRVYTIDKGTKVTGDKLPIGYRLPDKEVLLLDDNGREVGPNQVGEIAVRTRYLSPGFWRRPDLTETKFLPDPDGGDRRIYLTGDLGRMLPDGCLEHLGRKDFQVKIRGLRVEFAEVEEALRSMKAIREAAVVAREDKPGDKRLVAYIVPEGNAPLSDSEVRRFAEQKLPPLMVPSRFVMLDALPLTPTGKVNRRVLPDPGNSRPDLDSPFVVARTPVEEKLSKIWAQVLSLDQVGIHDSFMELGGQSLSATQVISQVIKTFQVELPVRSLFETPTVAEMAVVIAQNQARKAGHEELSRMLNELKALSDEQAQRLLAEEMPEKQQ